MIDLKKEIREKQISVVMIPNERYKEDMIEITKYITLNFKKPCFVNLNRPYSALVETLTRYGIDHKKIFFIDGITKIATEKSDEIKNCVFLAAPNNLVELSLTITKTFETLHPDVFVFDSLSTLLIYENINTVTKFVQGLAGKIRTYGSTTIFTALEGDTETQLIRELKSFVDNVVHIKND